MSVRVRYAPSPTGSPHVGNIRTALYNHLFARKHGGTNILRIEDTDRARLVEGCEAEIIESLKYVGIDWQEGIGAQSDRFGPYRQSERNAAGIYAPHWLRLLEQGDAYWAFETPEELDAMRKRQAENQEATGYFGGDWRDASAAQIDKARAEGKPAVVRLRIPRDKTIMVDDAVRGRIEYDSNVVDDPVLIKADGMPTYHFAAMVDDHLMEITHIFRGEEWISSAPKHMVLFEALGWTAPIMVHLPVIKGKDGSKLSKRHGDTACLDFRRAGYTGEALANFIALIGWSPGEDREVMSMDEMTEAFDLRGLQPSSGVFDIDKLTWMSGMHIRRADPHSLLNEVKVYAARPETELYWSARPEAHINMKGLAAFNRCSDETLGLEAIKLARERVSTLADFGEACAFLFTDEVSLDPVAQEKWFTQPDTPRVLQHLIERLEEEAMSTPEQFEQLLRDAQGSLGLENMGGIVHPVRVALTGKTTGPGLFELMAVLGRDRVLKRLKDARDKLS